MRGDSCVICGHDGDVRTGVVEWLEPQDGNVWTTLPRCHDRQACRDRLEAAGDVWPLRDHTRPSPKPMPPSEAPPADVGGATWFD